MLRFTRPVRALTQDDLGWAVEQCAADPGANVFPLARLLEHGVSSRYGELLAHAHDGGTGLLWAGANVVPVNVTADDVDAFATRLRRGRYRSSSIFGPAEAVLALWSRLEPWWGPAREVRPCQPLMTATGPSAVKPDPCVRRARPEELDLLVPAAAAMFTEEIGYPPYTQDDRAYRESVRSLIHRGQSLIRVEDGRMVFKADVGSVAGGVAQVQGVWVAPELRGRGLAAPAMAAVNAVVLREMAPVVNLYVNDFNARARRTYERVGYVQTGTFATVLL